MSSDTTHTGSAGKEKISIGTESVHGGRRRCRLVADLPATAGIIQMVDI